MNEERMKILDMIERGVITAEQGSQLLQALENSFEAEEDELESMFEENEPIQDTTLPEPEPRSYTALPPVEVVTTPTGEDGASSRQAASPGTSPNFARWRNWWYYPLAFGIVVTVLSGWLLYVGTQNEWAGFWIACTWLPLLLGVLVITVAWASHRALWLHVRVNTGQDEWPRRVAISFPLPLRFGAWVMKVAQDRVPGVPNLKDVPLDEIIDAVKKGVKPESPIHIEVDNGPGQEKVEVYIG